MDNFTHFRNLYPVDKTIYRETGRRKGLLSSIDLELSRRCNFQCGYCYADSGLALDNEMTFSEITKLIQEGKEIGLRSVVIVGGGEPLLVPYLEKLVEFIRGNKLHCAIVTNGYFLDEKKARFLFKKQVALCVKINSLDNPQIFNSMVKVKDAYNRAHKAVKLLLKTGYAGDKGPALAVESVAYKKNIEEIPKIWRWARNNNILPIVEFVTPQGRAGKNGSFIVKKEQAGSLFSVLSKIDKVEYNKEWEPLPSIAGSPCRRLYYSCYVNSTGDVLPCGGINIPIGNIREASLKRIIAGSELLSRLRQPHLFLKGKCGRCEIKEKCYGCRGKAFWKNCDPFDEDPLCWR